MARDPEKAVLRVVDESPPKPQEIVRLTSKEGIVIRSEPVPLQAPPERLEPEEHATEEKRTHEPDQEALVDVELAPLALEESWESSSRSSKPVAWGWFALFGLAIAGGVLWSISHLEQNKDTPLAARSQSIETLDKEIREREAAELTVNRILDCVRAYCTADSIDKLVAVSRHPERVRPLMEEWYGRKPLKPEQFESLNLLQPVTLENKGSFWMVSCTMNDGGKRHLLLEQQDDGSERVDWETEVCYQPMDWDRYATERPAGSMDFRVRITPDNLFSHEFSDSDRWACFRLKTLKGEQVLFGYVERNSDEGIKLIKLLEQGRDHETAVLLRISVPVGLKSPSGVVIEKLMSPRWTYVEPPGT